jgi:predicted MFS family arabinose efflux permease
MVGVLLASGCLRSLQFTSINAIAYADIDQQRMSQASSLAAMAQQVALALGVTIGGYALSLAGLLTGRPGAADQLHLRLPHRGPGVGDVGVG